MMDEDFRHCKTPKEAYNILLTKLATGYVVTEPEGNTFEKLKGKFILTPAEKTEAKNPVKLFEILQRKGILKCPDCGPLKEWFRDVDHRALPFIEEAESWIRDQNGPLFFDGHPIMRKNHGVLKKKEEGDYEQILDETIEGIECIDETSTDLKKTLVKIRDIKYARIKDPLSDFSPKRHPLSVQTREELERINFSIKEQLEEMTRKRKDNYDKCRLDLEMTIEKADQQPRLAGFLRRTLHEDSTLGLGNENSTNVKEMLDDLESDGKIGPQKYSYLAKIMQTLDPRLGQKVERAKKKLQELQKALLKDLKKIIDEMTNGQVCDCHGKRKRDDQDNNRNSKRHDVSSH